MWNLETFAPGERKLCYVRSATSAGPPLALFHGVLRGWDFMLPLSLRLAGGYELWALDQRGHGMSDHAERYLTVDYVADAVAWLRDAVGKPMTLYGHSLGAMVAAAVAAECPELVRGVILEDPPFHTLGHRIRGTGFQSYFAALAPLVGSQEPISLLAKRLADVTFTDPATGTTTRLGDVRDPAALRFFAASLRRCDRRVVEPIIAGTWLDGYDCEAVFRNIQTPVLLLEADRAAGGMLDAAEVEQMKRCATDVSHVRMSGVGHAMHWQRTQEVVNLTIAFLESLDGA
jgi:pimeloyl-ACP methyl ester carboxylesterase